MGVWCDALYGKTEGGEGTPWAVTRILVETIYNKKGVTGWRCESRVVIREGVPRTLVDAIEAGGTSGSSLAGLRRGYLISFRLRVLQHFSLPSIVNAVIVFEIGTASVCFLVMAAESCFGDSDGPFR